MRDGTGDETSCASGRSELLFSTREARPVRGEHGASRKKKSFGFFAFGFCKIDTDLASLVGNMRRFTQMINDL